MRAPNERVQRCATAIARHLKVNGGRSRLAVTAWWRDEMRGEGGAPTSMAATDWMLKQGLLVGRSVRGVAIVSLRPGDLDEVPPDAQAIPPTPSAPAPALPPPAKVPDATVWITVQEAAELLGIGAAGVRIAITRYRRFRSKPAHPERPQRPGHLVDRADVLAYAKERNRDLVAVEVPACAAQPVAGPLPAPVPEPVDEVAAARAKWLVATEERAAAEFAHDEAQGRFKQASLAERHAYSDYQLAQRLSARGEP